MRIIRSMRGAVAGMAIALGLIAALPASAFASATPAGPRPASHSSCPSGTWQVVNSPGTYDSSPSPSHSNGVAVSNGSCLGFDCYYYGAPAGPYGDPLWYEVGFDFWINDHYLNTPGTAANPQPQGEHCWPGSGSSAGGASVGYGPIFTAENSPGRWGNSPTFARDVSGTGISTGDAIGLNCYYYGNATGPYGNTLWYLAEDITNNTYGWINDHYLSTPGTAANPQPQTSRC
jgi:hypothetical protein